ncbi:hypothetical protein Pla100_47750 [Neorhodopirellula pilleata]|uniref:Uncharacterized protein n=1 Tax=Neorhodopirellula pilleata TaxID=2714738 RepID=A0A5C5ZZ49_9BACT|nr:hypothetical protein Pla100_47750 [Neorhodopirellula pilleata]
MVDSHSDLRKSVQSVAVEEHPRRGQRSPLLFTPKALLASSPVVERSDTTGQLSLRWQFGQHLFSAGDVLVSKIAAKLRDSI